MPVSEIVVVVCGISSWQHDNEKNWLNLKIKREKTFIVKKLYVVETKIGCAFEQDLFDVEVVVVNKKWSLVLLNIVLIHKSADNLRRIFNFKTVCIDLWVVNLQLSIGK